MPPARIAKRGGVLTIITELYAPARPLVPRFSRLPAKLDRLAEVVRALPDLLVTIERTRCPDCERRQSLEACCLRQRLAARAREDEKQAESG
jgi:hypothetical protein